VEDSARSNSFHSLLVEEVAQHRTNLQNQYTRMHARMQLITGLNTALLPALGALAVAASKDEVGGGWLILFPVAGLLLSAIGYVAASADHGLVTVYRAQLARAVQLLVDGLPGAERATLGERWAYAGMSPRRTRRLLAPIAPPEDVPRWWDALTSRHRTSLSVTRLPAILSLVFVVVWLVILVLLAVAGP
jgi:hypothetical protein